MIEKNPYELDNPFIPAMELQKKHQEKEIEFQRLCYEVFHRNEDGKYLYEVLKERYLLQPKVDPTHPKTEALAMYYAGFNAALLGLYEHGRIHQQRISGQTGVKP